jgi:hypothetical protein
VRRVAAVEPELASVFAHYAIAEQRGGQRVESSFRAPRGSVAPQPTVRAKLEELGAGRDICAPLTLIFACLDQRSHIAQKRKRL